MNRNAQEAPSCYRTKISRQVGIDVLCSTGRNHRTLLNAAEQHRKSVSLNGLLIMYQKPKDIGLAVFGHRDHANSAPRPQPKLIGLFSTSGLLPSLQTEVQGENVFK